MCQPRRDCSPGRRSPGGGWCRTAVLPDSTCTLPGTDRGLSGEREAQRVSSPATDPRLQPWPDPAAQPGPHNPTRDPTHCHHGCLPSAVP